MSKFFYLEGAYLILGLVILLVTLFVVTRPFMGRFAKRYGLIIVFLFLAILISGHYYITLNRMKEVKRAFLEGKEIICENRVNRQASQSIIIQKDRSGWRVEGDFFKSPLFNRDFFLSRCVIYK